MLDSPGGDVDTPYSLEVHEEVPSTQDLARRRAAAERPAVVIAHRQSQGRGRSGAPWVSAPRGIAVSIGLVPEWPQETWPRIPLVAGVAARRVLGPAVTLKWPNDIVRSGRKVGGILVEAVDGTVVAGMGLNVHWSDPPDGIGALLEHDPGPEEGQRVAERWARTLMALLSSRADDWPRDEYVAACETIGQEIVWEPAGAGRAVGLAADGALVVETADGTTVELRSGEIRHVRTIRGR
ncbi:MAG TPA: biotin--[acetyl-CoA-carboxylase] ligase [Acidimicrobiia bacterium]|nr:biotin--[acetyl-CoA-carboxylase] ligase [Acidimicrobiia bacterium]